MAIATASPRSNADSVLLLIARLLFAYFFLPAGIGKIMGFAGTVGYISSVGMPLPQLAAAAAIVAEVGGGLAMILGFQTRLVSWGLAFFTLAATLMFHNYWALSGAAAATQQLMFNKNLGVIAGLLALSVAGAGAYSWDARRRGA